MKKISLRPYSGIVYLCESQKEYKKKHHKIFNEPIDLTGKNGRCDGYNDNGFYGYLVWANDSPSLAHEMAHVVIHVFKRCGIDPSDSDGEAFCYLLAQLLRDSK